MRQFELITYYVIFWLAIVAWTYQVFQPEINIEKLWICVAFIWIGRIGIKINER